jgi:hypothetical protein
MGLDSNLLENIESLSITDNHMNIEDNQNNQNNQYNQNNTTENIIEMMEECKIDSNMDNMDSHTIEPNPNYEFYSDFQSELEYELFQNNYDVYDKKNENCRKMCLDVPNLFCKNRKCVLDDEDYIYADLYLSDELKYIIHERQSVNEYVIKYIIDNKIIIDYNELIYSHNIVYAKTLYIYKFIYNYNNFSSNDNNCLQQYILHLPSNILSWIDNLITIIKNGLNMKAINYNTEYKSEYINIKEDYFKELLYGLNLCVCHLKMIINHCKSMQIPICNMENIYINKFFRVLNNLCIIIIFIKLVS